MMKTGKCENIFQLESTGEHQRILAERFSLYPMNIPRLSMLALQLSWNCGADNVLNGLFFCCIVFICIAPLHWWVLRGNVLTCWRTGAINHWTLPLTRPTSFCFRQRFLWIFIIGVFLLLSPRSSWTNFHLWTLTFCLLGKNASRTRRDILNFSFQRVASLK